MYQRDYLLRMIQQFSVMLGQVVFMRQNQRFNEALELLAQSMKRLLGLNSKLVRSLTVTDLLALLSTREHLDAGKGLLLSDMLKTEGEILTESGQEVEGSGCLLKSLELLLEMNKLPEADELKPEMRERVEALLPNIWHQNIPLHVLDLLLDYFSETGQLSKAEDALFFMLEDDPEHPGLIDRGSKMLGHWLELAPESLAEAGLTYKEVQESLDLLIKMKKIGT